MSIEHGSPDRSELGRSEESEARPKLPSDQYYELDEAITVAENLTKQRQADLGENENERSYSTWMRVYRIPQSDSRPERYLVSHPETVRSRLFDDNPEEVWPLGSN